MKKQMKNIQTDSIKKEFNSRIDKLQSTVSGNWGKMNAGQMLCHCLRLANGTKRSMFLGNFMMTNLFKWLILTFVKNAKRKSSDRK